MYELDYLWDYKYLNQTTHFKSLVAKNLVRWPSEKPEGQEETNHKVEKAPGPIVIPASLGLGKWPESYQMLLCGQECGWDLEGLRVGTLSPEV